MVNNDNITVMQINTEGRFYWIDESEIEFYDEKAKEVVERKKQPEKTFDNEEVKKLTKGRIKSKILRTFEKLKEKIKSRGRNDGRESI